MTSQKISQFNVSTSLNNSDLFTFVVNGTNKNISYSSFKSDLGVTGTLSQVGSPLGAPILDNNGSDYFIRNLESSKGVIASVSAQNGVVLASNFKQGVNGVPLITDLNANQYEFKTIAAGANISVTDNSDHVTIGFNPTSGASKTVVVSTIDDFPAAVSGVITLAPDTDYLITDNITTSNRFVLTGSVTIRAASSQIVTLKTTNAGTMFTGTQHNVLIRGITLSAPNGALFDFSNISVTGIFQFIESNVEECNSIGTFNNLFILRFDAIGWEDIKTTGMTLSGVIFNADLDRGVVFLNNGTFIDLGTAVLNELSVSKQIIQLSSNASATFLSGLASSGNILPGGLGAFTDNRVSVLTTPLTNVAPSDNRFEFLFNAGIPDSINDGLISVSGSTTETVISATGVKVKITNTWTNEDSSRFSFDANGRLTYTGERPARLPIDLSATLLMASGGDKQAELSIAINGTPVAATSKQATISSTKAASFTTVWQYEFKNGDYVEAFVSNESDTVNIIAQQAIIRIN